MARDTRHFEIDPEERQALARAVRATIHDQVIDLLERRGVLREADMIECPSCHDRTILLDQPATFVLRGPDRVCAACAAERDFINLVEPDADFGGEGGG